MSKRKPPIVLIAVLLVLLAIAIPNFLASGVKPIKTSEVYSKLTQGKIIEATWQETELRGTYQGKDDERIRFTATVPKVDSQAGSELQNALVQSGVTWTLEGPHFSSQLVSVMAVAVFPILVFASLYYLVIKPSQRRIA